MLQNNRSWGFEESDGASVLPVIFDFCKIVPNTSGIQNIQTFLLSFSNFVHCSSLTRQEFLRICSSAAELVLVYISSLGL